MGFHPTFPFRSDAISKVDKAGSDPLTGRCHCGAVGFEVRAKPDFVTSCNCSICHRIGALWVHAPVRDVTITSAPDATISYIQGDRTLAVHTCKSCGCTTHWENLIPERHDRMAVNVRMSDPTIVASLRVRRFDGANTWAYLDD